MQCRYVYQNHPIMSAPVPEEHIVKILFAEYVTHNVRRFRVEKPDGFRFTPGQATDVCINKDGWKTERRPFTFTGLAESEYLEFTIKIYTDHGGVTAELGKLNPGDELILHDVYGTITYKGEGSFIAGGAGLTPFLAILRRLHKDGRIGNNRLLFSNRTVKDIILKDELQAMLGDRFIPTITQEEDPQYEHRKIDASFLKEKISDFSGYFYICGPDEMVAAIKQTLLQLGATEQKIVIEEF
jgi:ferredoxin-NADP reductase